MPKCSVITNKYISKLKIKIPKINYCSVKNCNRKYYINDDLIYKKCCNECSKKIIAKKLSILGKMDIFSLAKKVCCIHRNNEQNNILRWFINHIYLKNLTRRKCEGSDYCYICKNNIPLISKLNIIKNLVEIINEKKVTDEMSKLMI